MTLPNDADVYPTHFSGLLCGLNMSGKPHSTIGFERRFNLALKPRSRDEFIEFMLANLPPQSPEFATNRQRNLGVA